MVRATDLDKNAFGFSISDLATEIGLRLQSLLGSASGVQRVKELLDPTKLRYAYLNAANSVMVQWTQGTVYAGLVRVNLPLRTGFINLYIFEHDYLQAKSAELSCGCSYIPGSWSIVCDEAFLSSIQRYMDGKNAPTQHSAAHGTKGDDESPRAWAHEFFLEWVLAHELGHLVNNHTARDLERSWTFDGGVPVGLQAEKEADEFYISNMQNQTQAQVSAYFTLSSLITNLYAWSVYYHRAEDNKEGGSVFGADTYVDIYYSPHRHPPLLIRALNLADILLKRYPQMVDSTGYFDRIRRHIRFKEGSRPNSPQLCHPDVGTETDPSELQVLGGQLQLLEADGAPAVWKSALVEKIRVTEAGIGESDEKDLSKLTTDLLKVEVSPSDPDASTKISAIEAASDDLPEAYQAALKVLSLTVRSRIGLLKTDSSVVAALKIARSLLIRANGAGYGNWQDPAMRFEMLRLLLEIQLGAAVTRTPEIENAINSAVYELDNLPEVPPVMERLVGEELQADFDRQSTSMSNPLSSANAAFRMADFAEQRAWYTLGVHYRAAGTALLMKLYRPPLRALAFTYMQLGDDLSLSGNLGSAPQAYRNSLGYFDEILDPPAGESDPEWAKLNRLRLTVLNNLGWSLFVGQQFPEALPILERVNSVRTKAHGNRPCIAGNKDDEEFATVSQNLADDSLALGRYRAAVKYAHVARLCRDQSKQVYKASESAKTEGFALIYEGHKGAGISLLKAFRDTARQMFDDNTLLSRHDLLGGSIVNGVFVPLDQFIEQLPDRPFDGPIEQLPDR